MSLSGFIRAVIAFGVAIVMLYILEITFGAAMDGLYVQFYYIITGKVVQLGAGWDAIALNVLGGWKWFFRSFIIVIIAIGVWVVEMIIIEVDYARQLK